MRWRAALALVAALLFVGCGREPEAVPARPTATPEIAGTPRTVTRTVQDQVGRTVAIGDEVERVVALSPGAAHFAVALGLEVVGRTTDTPVDSAPGAQTIGTTLSPDFAAVAALAPDLVLADAAYHSGRTRDFDRFAYPVYVLGANSYPEVLAALEALGKATGREEEAKSATAAISAQADAARASAGPVPPKVLILTGGGRDVFAAGSETYLGSLVAELGGINVFGSTPDGGPIPGFGVVEVSQAASFEPDIVLVLSSGQGGLVAQITADPAWAETPAVRANRVIELDTLLYLRAPGPRVGEALVGLANLLW